MLHDTLSSAVRYIVPKTRAGVGETRFFNHITEYPVTVGTNKITQIEVEITDSKGNYVEFTAGKVLCSLTITKRRDDYY